MQNKKHSKKAQHEIMGFVIIVLIVTIIALIFLSFSIGRGVETQNSLEISKLLGATFYYTTDCSTTFIPDYKNIQDLIKECYKNQNNLCLSGENVCKALNETLDQVISNSLQVHEDSPNKAYKLNIYYRSLESETIPDEQVLNIEKGIFSNCSSQVGGSQSIDITGFSIGQVNVELSLCVNK